MDLEVHVYVQLDGADHRVGTLWLKVRQARQSASFEYAQAWLDSPNRFALEPALVLSRGAFHAGGLPGFGAIGDSAPDGWGRRLMQRAERRRAKAEQRAVRTLLESDYLLGVGDEGRMGALRFRLADGGPFLAAGGMARAPVNASLARLLGASERLQRDKESDEDLRTLLQPGALLGGARPKASVHDPERGLLVAKFPKIDDDISVVRWERAALKLARAAGIHTATSRLVQVARRPVLLLDRFDRQGERRVPYLSAMSMLGASDGDHRSYLEIMDALRQFGAAAKEDGRELWRRIVFNVLISNVDDHLRNHGFLFDGGRGWRLSPAYDLNPVPIDIKARMLSTSIEESDPSASLELALSVCQTFGLKLQDARAIAGHVGAAAAKWRETARSVGIRNAEIDRMATAFEHEDLQLALEHRPAGEVGLADGAADDISEELE